MPRNQLVISVNAVRAALLLALVVLFVAIGVSQRERIAVLLMSPETRAIDRDTYQAVFLISSQVYFGKLSLDGDAYTLTDVFYLASAPEGSQPGTLIKRGTELHGPRNAMVIPARSVLYFENMREDAQVMAAIRAYKSGAQPQPLATPAPTSSARPSRSP